MSSVNDEQKILAIVVHLAYFLGGVGFIIAPLVIFLLKKDDTFVQYHAKQALVAHLAVLAFSLAVSMLCLILVGVLLLPVLAIIWLGLVVTSIIAAIKALNGELYDYPLIQGLIKRF